VNKLISYWITFPEEDQYFIIGIGVTAFSIDDAFHILEYFHFNQHKVAKRVEIKENVTIDELEYNHIELNMGPIVVRGIWYPYLNHQVFPNY
jgi:hypothetical protein